ncbi:Protein of unknown function DUF3093 [Candidatus Nanopelagicaceae bacterium]
MLFKEVIRPPLWLLAFIYFMFLSLVIAVWAALGNFSALVTLIALTLALLAIAMTAKSEVRITEDELVIGKAHIGVKYLAGVEILDENAMRLLRTRDADPAAFLAIKFWMSTGVKITLNDPRDPTPYWLVSCKKGKELKSTLYK